MDFCPFHGVALVPSPRKRSDPLLGMVLDDRYRIDELIGQGAMGRVYRAQQLNVGRDVAVKILNAVASQNLEIVTRFEAEAKIISRLRHPNTLKLLDFGRCPDDDQLFIVLELLKGLSLEDVLQRGALKPIRVLGLLRQVLDALSEAHEEGIVHRDLKPANIMLETVGGNEIVKVVDFGIAKVVSGVNVTATGRVIGTPAYMSPEQIQGVSITHSSDLYSLGVVAYECLCGQLPFGGSTAVSLMLKHLNDPPPNPMLSGSTQQVPKAVADFVFSLLQKKPEGRPGPALAARKEVDRLERDLLTSPPVAIGPEVFEPTARSDRLLPGSLAPTGFSDEPQGVIDFAGV